MSLERLRVALADLVQERADSPMWSIASIRWSVAAILEHLIQQEEAKQKETG